MIFFVKHTPSPSQEENIGVYSLFFYPICSNFTIG